MTVCFNSVLCPLQKYNNVGSQFTQWILSLPGSTNHKDSNGSIEGLEPMNLIVLRSYSVLDVISLNHSAAEVISDEYNILLNAS